MSVDPAAPSASELVLVTRVEGVVTLTLNRPERKNVMGPDGWAAILAALRGIDQRVDRVLVLTGAGGDFCAGADVSVVPDRSWHPFERLRLVGDVAVALHRLAIPSIARVSGVAVGAGMNLALGCDLVVASTTARFSQIFSQRGLSPDCGGTWLLPRLIGLSRAKELALLGEIIPAQTAADYGLVHRLVEPESLDATVQELAGRLAAGPTTALGLTRAMLNNAFEVSLQQAVDDEGKALGINIETDDAREAIAAFREKRQPKFTGR